MVLNLLVGLAFIGTAMAMRRAPLPVRVWWSAVGAAWWLGDLALLRLAHQGVLIGALATFPTGRPRTVGQRITVGTAAVVALGVLGQAGAAVGFLAVAAVGARGGAFARSASAVVGLWLAGSFVWSRAWPESFQPTRVLVGYEVILLLVALALPWGLRVESRRRAALDDRVLATAPLGLAGLEGALRRASGRRSLRLQRTTDGAVVEGLGPADVETVAAIERAVSLTVAHERAMAETALLLAQREAARGRLLAAADVERRRAARRLRGELTALRACQGALAERPDVAQEIEAAVVDVERIVADLPPEGLGCGGIGRALVRLCARHPVPVSLGLDERAAGDIASETALFYVCSEALANSAKHAHAGSVVVTLEAGDLLVLTVADDGIGGADPRGPGLLNLHDRLSTAGGTLAVDSRPGAGTRLVARLPGHGTRTAQPIRS